MKTKTIEKITNAEFLARSAVDAARNNLVAARDNYAAARDAYNAIRADARDRKAKTS